MTSVVTSQSQKTLAEYRDWFKSIGAGNYDEFEKFRFHLMRQLASIPLTLSGKRVMEVGCGQGTVSLYLALFSDAKHIIGLDEASGKGSPIGVTKSLRDAIPYFGINHLQVIEADIMQNYFANNSFDLIIANNALHHVVNSGFISSNDSTRREYVNLFAELRRLLIPEGILSLWEFSRISFWRWSPIKFKWKNIDWKLHPTKNEWLSVLSKSGFTVTRLEYSVPYRLRNCSMLFSNSLSQFFLYSGFFITARA